MSSGELELLHGIDTSIPMNVVQKFLINNAEKFEKAVGLLNEYNPSSEESYMLVIFLISFISYFFTLIKLKENKAQAAVLLKAYSYPTFLIASTAFILASTTNLEPSSFAFELILFASGFIGLGISLMRDENFYK